MKKSYLHKAHEFLTYGLFFMLPFPDKILPLMIVLWIVSWLLMRIFSQPTDLIVLNKNQRVGLLLFLIWVVFGFLTAFLTEDSSGMSLVERRLFFLFVPIVLLIGESKSIKSAYSIQALVMGSVVMLCFCILPIYVHCQRLDIVNALFQHRLSLYKHHAYLALVVTCGYFLYASLLKKAYRLDMLFLGGYFIVLMLYFNAVSSRMGMINLVFMFLLLIFSFRLDNKWSNKNYIVLLVSLLLFTLLISTNQKFLDLFVQLTDGHGGENRDILWKSSIDIIMKKPLFGYGLGGGENVLLERCFENGLPTGEQRLLNSHNQILQSLIDNGIVGLILLGASLYYLLKGSKYRRMHLLLLLIIMCAFFTESMFQRIAGIALFSLSVYLMVVPVHAFEQKNNKTLVGVVLIGVLLFTLLVSVLLSLNPRDYSYDSHNPRSYAESRFTVVNDLPGEVPLALDGAKGYQLDRTATPYAGYPHLSVTRLLELEENYCDSVCVSAYCYVSEDFNGEVYLGASGKAYGDKKFYNKKYLKDWQLLDFKIIGPKLSRAIYGLYLVGPENANVGKVQGYVIFALPEYRVYKAGEIIKSSN